MARFWRRGSASDRAPASHHPADLSSGDQQRADRLRVVIDDRQVPQLRVGHVMLDRVQRIVLEARFDRTQCLFVNPRLRCLAGRDRAHRDVAARHAPHHPVVVAHGQRANIVALHPLRGGADRVGPRDRLLPVTPPTIHYRFVLKLARTGPCAKNVPKLAAGL
nr:hypothetical protein [Burkholderia metallica]